MHFIVYSENSYVVILSIIEQFYICTSVGTLKSDAMLTRYASKTCRLRLAQILAIFSYLSYEILMY